MKRGMQLIAICAYSVCSIVVTTPAKVVAVICYDAKIGL